MSNVASTLLTFLATMLPVSETMSNEISFFLDKVETHRTCSIRFDFVERTKFYNRTVRYCCRLWQQSRMLLGQSGMLLRQCCLLLRHCCWCGRGLRYTTQGRGSQLSSDIVTWRSHLQLQYVVTCRCSMRRVSVPRSRVSRWRSTLL